jgi:hypothetical protein
LFLSLPEFSRLWTGAKVSYMTIPVKILIDDINRLFVNRDRGPLVSPEKGDFLAAGFAIHGFTKEHSLQ